MPQKESIRCYENPVGLIRVRQGGGGRVTTWSTPGTITTSIWPNKNRWPSCLGQGSKSIAPNLPFKTQRQKITNSRVFFPSFRKFNLSENFKCPFENYGYLSQTSSAILPLPPSTCLSPAGVSQNSSVGFLLLLFLKNFSKQLCHQLPSQISFFSNVRLIFYLSIHIKVLSHKNMPILNNYKDINTLLLIHNAFNVAYPLSRILLVLEPTFVSSPKAGCGI